MELIEELSRILNDPKFRKPYSNRVKEYVDKVETCSFYNLKEIFDEVKLLGKSYEVCFMRDLFYKAKETSKDAVEILQIQLCYNKWCREHTEIILKTTKPDNIFNQLFGTFQDTGKKLLIRYFNDKEDTIPYDSEIVLEKDKDLYIDCLITWLKQKPKGKVDFIWN